MPKVYGSCFFFFFFVFFFFFLFFVFCVCFFFVLFFVFSQVIETYIPQYLVNDSLPYLESSCYSVKLTEMYDFIVLSNSAQ